MKTLFVKPKGNRLGLIELWDLSSDEFNTFIKKLEMY